MHKTVGICLAAMFLLSNTVSAQTLPARDGRSAFNVERQSTAVPLIRDHAASGRLSPAKLPPLAAAPDNRWGRRISPPSRASRSGALIGLAVGVAAATVYWTVSNCRYGSDSSSAVMAQCVVPTAAMIGGGWYIGRALGK